MRYNPDDVGHVEPGEYTFTVVKATDTQSKAGNEMIELQLAFDVGTGKDLNTFDRLVNTPKALWKVRQFCDAVGIGFESGELDADNLLGVQGTAKLILGQKNDKGRQYMEVEEYVSLKPSPFSESPTPTPQQKTRAAGNAVAKAVEEHRRNVAEANAPMANAVNDDTPSGDDIPF